MKIENAEFVRSVTQGHQLIQDGLPEIAFVGRSNVGKSSLMNRLLARKGLARTSSTPGRTQSVNYFLVNRRFYFVDLPGYGYAKASKQDRQRWAELMAQYLGQTGGRSLLVQLIDGKVGATDLDCQASEYLTSLGHAPVVVATKIDKVPQSRRVRGIKTIHQSLDLASEAAVIPVSAVSGEGIKQVWNQISAFLDHSSEEPRKAGTP
ncbi:MAG: YihA family ribosome biogenesis GTP-binding protein [Thermoanaerobaculia bacterium]|nr:YihA family ribosome biogenesis GTP-binding protein [Thermoanaerobaculia bacterium]